MAAEIPRADLVIFQVYLICSFFLTSEETANMLRKERERERERERFDDCDIVMV